MFTKREVKIIKQVLSDKRWIDKKFQQLVKLLKSNPSPKLKNKIEEVLEDIGSVGLGWYDIFGE